MRDLRQLPKAHLHLHLTGSARMSTIRELADEYGINLPSTITEEKFSWTGDPKWSHFQDRYDAARQAIRSPEDVRRIIREAAEDDAAEGSEWLELQIDPSSYVPYLGGWDPAVNPRLRCSSRGGKTTPGGYRRMGKCVVSGQWLTHR